MKIRLLFFLWFSFLIAPIASAQANCPPSILLSFARSGSACYGLERNQACIGNGTVSSDMYADSTPFAAPGDRSDAAALHVVRTEAIEEGMSVALVNSQASLTQTEERSVALLLFGDAAIENQVPPLPELAAFATGALNIRQTPENNGDIITRMAVNQAVIANGRTEAGDWLRVHVPNSNDLGWVAADVINPNGDILTLAVVGVDTPVYRPFQVVRLTSGDAVFCDAGLSSGLLLQTPNAVSVKMTLNGVDMELTGAFFLQAQDALAVSALAGQGTFTAGGEAQFLPAGSRLSIPLDDEGAANTAPSQPEPYDLAALQALPVNNLPYQMQIAQALTAEQIAQQTADYFASLVAAAQPVASHPADTTCQRVTLRHLTLWGGPGLFYEAVNELSSGTRVNPVLQTVDADGNVWWQLSGGNWIQAALVEVRGNCGDIPVTTVVQPPTTNTLSLETCESNNGPLRAGQQVTIQFIPPAFDNYGEARDAARIDPGRITIGSQVYRAYASDPIRLGTVGERYLRRFYIYWTAVPGTYRIVGDRLAYIPICTVTVPVS